MSRFTNTNYFQPKSATFQLACQQGTHTVGNAQLTIRVPCHQPTPSCPQPPTGPGTGHLGTIPWTNIEIHTSKLPNSKLA